MFNTRTEVDKHVENCLKRINNEKERNLRSLSFAKLYYNVGNYQQARRYVQMYLNLKSTSAEAQHLLGNCLEKLGQKEAAADAYRSSLSLDPTQATVILKLCQLLAENDMDLDSLDSGASYYCERAQALDPGNQYAQQLREKLLTRSSRDPNEITQLLLKEVENRPGDAECSVRLLKHLSNNNQLKIAVNHIHLTHTTNISNLYLFLRQPSYVNTSADILLRYHRENAVAPTLTVANNTASEPLNWQFWMLLITTLDALVALTSVDLAGSGEKKGNIWNMWVYDQMLSEAIRPIDSCPEKQLASTFLQHHRGQVCYHLATLLLRQARLGLLKWREAVSAALPLLFAGYHAQPPDTTALWLEHSTGLGSSLKETRKGRDIVYDAKELVKRWNIDASDRCSQLGYVLYALGKDRKTEMVERAKQGTTGSWREQLYKKLFVTRDYQSKMKTSYFTTNADLLDICLRLPEPQTLQLYATVAQLHYPDSLHHLIWLYLNQYRNGTGASTRQHSNRSLTTRADLPLTSQDGGAVVALAEFSYPVMGGSLPLSVNNLGNCAAETLNVMDIQAFVYCATLCCEQDTGKYGGNKLEEQDRPPLLPAAIMEQLGSINQINWLKAAFRVQRGECYFSGGTDKNELRLTLIRGIETIRCIGNHGIDVAILVQLARIFQTRAKNLKSHSEIEFNDARAELYWKAAMPLLERLKNKHSINYYSKRLFEGQTKLSSDEVEDAIEDGKLFYGVMYLKKKELERALVQFKNLKDPYSSYYQAQIYEVMATEHIHGRKNITTQQRAQSLNLFTQARDCLYLTLDRLRDPSVDRNHPLNAVLAVQIESVERKLARLQGDLEGQGDGHHHDDTDNKEEGDDDGEGMVTARDILSRSLLNSSLPHAAAYQHSTSHHIYSTPISSHTSNSTPNVPNSNPRLQLFPHSSAIQQHTPTSSLRRDEVLRTRDEARPSPERLDAQLRQLSLARDTTSAQVMEQNRAVLEELRGIREGVGGLTLSVNELKAFNESKNAVEDLQSVRNLQDMVQEMKREIAELKSNSKQQQQQITEEDLYNALEEEYGADFANAMPNTAVANAGLNSSLAAAALGSGLYQNLPRMAAAAAAASAAGSVQQMGGLNYNPAAAAAAAAAAAGLYPALYPGIYPPYAGLGITQGNLPFVNPSVGPSDSHHPVLPTLGDYRNPLAHSQLPHHVYPTPPPAAASIQPPPISNNMQMPPLNYPHPPSFAHLQQQPGNVGLYSAGPTNLTQSTTMAPSPHGGLGGAGQMPLNMFKDAASITAGPNKAGFGVIPFPVFSQQQQQQQQPQINLSQGLNMFGSTMSSTPAIASIGESLTTTTSTALGGLSFGNLALSSPASTFTPSTIPVSAVTAKPAPVNVVITSSDPLPTPTTTKSPILSVVIPPQHMRQSKPHNYQIPLPTTGTVTVHPSVLNQPVGVVTTQGMLASVGPPIYSAVDSGRKDRSLGGDDIHNKSNLSSASIEEHDAQADFKPIIPLPDEVEVITGEEDETVLFCARGKLHRFVDTEWKERGIGDIKLLQNTNGKVRILMRRERIHKICANHYITAEMQFGPKANMDTAYIWVANDFADETVSLEKFCIRFKTADIATEFALHFDKAQTAAKLQDSIPKITPATTAAAPNLGGFVFTSTPTFKPKEDVTTTTPIHSKPADATKSSPFAGFTFNTTPKSDTKTSTPIKPDSATKSSKGGNNDEFIPTAEFKPVIPLPELVSIKTGEENSQVLFECHTKLLRFNSTDKEWKERGVGQMKIVKDDKIVRLLMRRDQVFKVCCNHQLFRNIDFSKMPNSTKIINWCAKDYSEGVFEIQTFALKFKNEELAKGFLDAITNAKELLDLNGNLLTMKDEKLQDSGENEKKVKTSTNVAPTKTTGFGDKFKLKSGSWECKNCYIHNEVKDNYCVACETPKNDSIPKKTEQPANISFGSNISFGIPSSTSAVVTSTFTFGTPKSSTTTNVTSSSIVTNSFGNAFRPEEGSWECKECYVRNKAGTIACSSCTTSKDGAIGTAPPVVTSTTNSNLPSGLTFLTAASDAGTTTQSQFKFGFPTGNTEGGGFTFGASTGVTVAPLSFTYLSAPTTTTPPKLALASTTTPSTAGFTFGSSSAHTFEFQSRHSPRKHSSNSQSGQSLDGNVSVGDGNEQVQQDGSGTDGGDDSYAHEEEKDNIYFKPVIPLPDEVAVVTGEEDETVVYEQRAKLYRFVDGQWKERGTGNLKLLNKQGSCKARAVMRREHVHKVCLNHSITPDISYTVKNEKSWQFAAADFSEGDIEYLQFCLRFRTAEIALEFKAAIDDIMSRISGGSDGDTIASGSKTRLASPSSDVVFISETDVTEEERNEALKLSLPPKFMAYRQLPDCSCEQCKQDDLYYNTNIKATTDSSIAKQQSPSTPAASTDADLPTTTTKSDSLRDLIQKPLNAFFVKRETYITSPSITTGASTVFGGVAITDKSEATSNSSKTNLFAQQPSSLFGASSGTFFGASQPPIFGTPAIATVTSVPGTASNSIFSSAATSNASIFGGGSAPKIVPATTNLFASPAPTANLFGGIEPAKPFAVTGSVFGTSNTSKSIFSTPSSSANVFGIPTNIFSTSNASSSNSSIFGTCTATNASTSTTINTFGTPVSTTPTGLFGLASTTTVAPTNIFGGNAVISGFGAAKESTTSSKAALAQQSSNELMFSASDSVSFASLAAATGAPPTSFKSDSTFTFANAGAPVFASLKSRTAAVGLTTNTNQDGGDNAKGTLNTSDGGATEDANYDPHYAPIVPLPDEIVVTTGEEDEEVIFSERSKLFRWVANSKEWKERGIGQMKLLFNPKSGVYRMLLRREGVHKIVLNCRVTKDMDLLPMNKNEKSYVWVAHNFLEETGTVEQEKLAAQFKNIDLACMFYRKVQEAINHINKLSKQEESKASELSKEIPLQPQALPTTLPQSSNVVQSKDSFSQPQQNVDYGEDDEESDYGNEGDEEYDDDKNIMSSKPCKLAEQLQNGNTVILGEGLLQLFYDEDCFGVRISFTEPDGAILSSTLIGTNTHMALEGNQCRWTSVELVHDPPDYRNLIATFETEDDAHECYYNYQEGVTYAQQADIQDILPTHADNYQ